MNAPKDGGPAFPVFERVDEFNDAAGAWTHRDVPTGGMSLRDYFAAEAMAAPWAEALSMANNGLITDEDADTLAANCYTVADAMLRARAVVSK